MKTSFLHPKKESLFTVFLLLLIWGLASRHLSPLILPGPAAVLAALGKITADPGFWYHVGATSGRALFGFGAAFLSGTAAGALMGASPAAGSLLQPLMVIIRSTPLIAITLLAVFWLKAEAIPLFVTFLVVFPIIAANVSEGVKNIDDSLIEMARLFRVKKFLRLKKLYLPSLLPYLLSAGLTGLGMSWKAVLTAEVIAYPALGIGTRMDRAKTFLKTEELLAWTVIVLLASFLFDRILAAAAKKYSKWKDSNGYQPGEN